MRCFEQAKKRTEAWHQNALTRGRGEILALIPTPDHMKSFVVGGDVVVYGGGVHFVRV